MTRHARLTALVETWRKRAEAHRLNIGAGGSQADIEACSHELAAVLAEREGTRPPTHISGLSNEIASALNRYSAENESNTPDFILAKFLLGCLQAWDNGVRERERWYGRSPNDGPGQIQAAEGSPATAEGGQS